MQDAHGWQPISTAVPTVDTVALAAAIADFQAALPDWWFSVCACSVSRDASCGPDRAGADGHLLDLETRIFDDGFHADLRDGTLADALREVMAQALEAKAAVQPLPAPPQDREDGRDG